MARPLTHLTHGISTRRPFHPAKTANREQDRALEDDAANLKRAAAVSGTVLDVLAVVLIANEPKHGAERQNRGRKREHLLRIRD